jgi:hypothetical protein
MSDSFGRVGWVSCGMLAFNSLGLMRSHISAPKVVIRMTSIQSSQSFIPFKCVEVDMLYVFVGVFTVRKMYVNCFRV